MEKSWGILNVGANCLPPAKGNVLISEPFLRDANFSRTVVFIVEHDEEGSVGVVLNRLMPMHVNDVVEEFKYVADIPLYQGGPVSTDTLFYLHVLPGVKGALPVGDGVFLNGDFAAIKRYVLQGNPLDGKIRFFIGCSGWGSRQLQQEIDEKVWLISHINTSLVMNAPENDLWKTALSGLGERYERWTRFPENPKLN